MNRKEEMEIPFLLHSRFLFVFLFLFLAASTTSVRALDHTAKGGGWRRNLLSFKETRSGSNLTFECSPSGPCFPCLYSEKNEPKYRCSETGYRIPMKCVAAKGSMKDENGKNSQNGRSAIEIIQNNTAWHIVSNDSTNKQRSLLDDSSTDGSQPYITYRSCIPSIDEEKLSVLGFEAFIFGLLLISGSVVYFRRKRTATMPGVGAGRIQMNSRF